MEPTGPLLPGPQQPGSAFGVTTTFGSRVGIVPVTTQGPNPPNLGQNRTGAPKDPGSAMDRH